MTVGKMSRSKRFIVTRGVEDLETDKAKLIEMMSRFRCAHYYAVFHPKEGREIASGHYHIYIELYEKTDIFLIQDYFGRYCSVEIPRDKLNKVIFHLSEFNKYKVIVDGQEIDLSKD